jgi:hypothetical protein
MFIYNFYLTALLAKVLVRYHLTLIVTGNCKINLKKKKEFGQENLSF